MTPQEKAKELVEKFENGLTLKDCALIAVDEILNFQDNLFITKGSLAYIYWEEVKQEIDKL